MLKENQVFFSHGNRKTGEIPSVSITPVITCAAGVPCAGGGCYACKLARIYKGVAESWRHNLAIYQTNPDLYFSQLENQFRINRYFRMHVAGDIPNKDYFMRLYKAACAVPSCEIMLFTKQYAIVNECIKELTDQGGEYFPLEILPENLHIIYSGWGAFQPVNPYGLPESQVIFKNTTVPDEWKICGGNCSVCACRGVGCWTLAPGETIAFYKH